MGQRQTYIFLIYVHVHVNISNHGSLFDQIELRSALVEVNLNDSLGGK